MKRHQLNITRGVVGEAMCLIGWHYFCKHSEQPKITAIGPRCPACECPMEYIREIRSFKPVSDSQLCLRGCGNSR